MGVLLVVCRTECDELREWRLCCEKQEQSKKDDSSEKAEKKTVTAKVDAVLWSTVFVKGKMWLRYSILDVCSLLAIFKGTRKFLWPKMS